MPKLRFRISMSLDGFVAGPRQSVENPLGIGGMRLHQWALPLAVRLSKEAYLGIQPIYYPGFTLGVMVSEWSRGEGLAVRLLRRPGEIQRRSNAEAVDLRCPRSTIE
jgi:hypothetical protein